MRNYWNGFKSWKKIVWDEKTDYKIPFGTRVKYALRGFSVNEYIWYNLKENDYREYISEYERLRSRTINGQYKFILDDKIIFEEVVGKYVRVPKNYAWVSEGHIYSLKNQDVNDDNILEWLEKYGKTVLKWNGKGGGAGTYVIEKSKDGFSVNGEKQSDEYVKELFTRKGKAILCEYITQSSFAETLYPYTTNTIRIVCAKKKDEQKAQVITAIQRVGCEASIPVDNVSSGGLTLEIDMETGELGHGIAKYGKKENRMVPFDVHPDSKTPLKGMVIPGWKELLAEMVELTNRLPYLNFVAWDVLLTEDGYVVIEGNASSGCGIFQMSRGIRNSPLGDIYRSYGIIKRG